MVYYKELDIDGVDAIMSKTLSFINERTTILSHGFDAPWYRLPEDEFLDYVPELKTAFSKYGLTPVLCGFLYLSEKTLPAHNVHIDTDTTARINIPILNVKGTQTVFYDNVITEKRHHPTKNYVYRVVTNDDYYEVDKIEIKTATVLRVHVGHQVVIPEGNPLPRIMLSMSFDKDPIFIFDNE